jgi:hypothetical protein
MDLNYPAEHLGEDAAVLKQLAAGRHPFCVVRRTRLCAGRGSLG